MKKRMIKKNLKKNKEKNRKKKRNIVVEVQIPSNANLRSPELQIPVNAGLRSDELQISKNQRVPINAQVVKEHEGWVFHLSQNDHSIYLETTDYHADPLRLTMENLHDLIALIEKTK
jgi:hypothetical protein